MKPLYLTRLSAFLLTGITFTASAQGSLDELAAAVKGGSASVNFRMRHESVDQDNALDDASATTLLSRLTLKTADWGALNATLEFDNLSSIGSDSYNSFVVDEYLGNHSVIADPVHTEVNQAYVGIKASESSSFSLGRHRINHLDQRFIGGVAWRQNEQTFDGGSWNYSNGAYTLDYSYVFNVNRIFASSKPSVQASDLEGETHMLLGSVKQGWGTLRGFVYALDFDDAAALSSMTSGVGYSGALGPVTLNATYATQSEHGSATLDYDAEFLSVDASVMAGPVKLLAGYDVLGSDDGIRGFATPLATLHKFQGFADLFLSTPANGIEDLYFTASGNLHGFALTATWHEFEADYGGADYGSELDLILGYRINDVINTQLKYASYDSDGFAVDTDKLWLSLMVAF